MWDSTVVMFPLKECSVHIFNVTHCWRLLQLYLNKAEPKVTFIVFPTYWTEWRKYFVKIVFFFRTHPQYVHISLCAPFQNSAEALPVKVVFPQGHTFILCIYNTLSSFAYTVIENSCWDFSFISPSCHINGRQFFPLRTRQGALKSKGYARRPCPSSVCKNHNLLLLITYTLNIIDFTAH